MGRACYPNSESTICSNGPADFRTGFIFSVTSLGADFGDLKKFRTGVSEITENLSFGRLFRMAALRGRCDFRRRNGKPNPLFALELRCITGHFSLVFSLYFLSFTQFILAQLLLQLAIKATLVLFSAFSSVFALLVLVVVVVVLLLLVVLVLVCCPRPPLSQILVASAQYQGLGRRLHVTCPVKDHQEKEVCSGFITLSAHLVGDERAVLGTGRHVARAVHHFQEHKDVTNDGQKLTSEVWWAVAPSDAPASP